MTDIMSAALIAAVPIVTGQIINMVISLKNGAVAAENLRAQKANTEKTEETARKVDVSNEKLVEIHTLTNGSLHQVTADLKVANEKILGMEKLLASMIDAKDAADKVIATTEAETKAKETL